MRSAFVVVMPAWLAALAIVVPVFVVWGLATWQAVRAFDRSMNRRITARYEARVAELTTTEGGVDEAPEGEGDDVPVYELGAAGAQIITGEAASPSSEPARAGDAELRETHYRTALEEIQSLDTGNYAGATAVRLASNALTGCDEDGNDLPGFGAPAPAHEEGSTHG